MSHPKNISGSVICLANVLDSVRLCFMQEHHHHRMWSTRLAPAPWVPQFNMMRWMCEGQAYCLLKKATELYPILNSTPPSHPLSPQFRQLNGNCYPGESTHVAGRSGDEVVGWTTLAITLFNVPLKHKGAANRSPKRKISASSI